jgi:hypothetical protein
MDLTQTASVEENQADLDGFVHLHRLYICLRDILSTDAYGPCLTTMAPHLPFLGFPGTNKTSGVSAPSGSQGLLFSDRLAIAGEIFHRLQQRVDADLVPVQSQPQDASRGVRLARATVQLTQLYHCNAILDVIFASPPDDDSGWDPPMFAQVDAATHGQGRAPAGPGDRTALWLMRETLAQKLLSILDSTPPDVLELNGFSLVSTQHL